MDSRKEEEILVPDVGRFVCYPIKHNEVWRMYKIALSCFWTSEEIDLATDVGDWNNKLLPAERTLFSKVLSFFAAFDGIVNENLVRNFCNEIQTPEHRCFYGFQVAVENVHGETYAMLLQTLVTDTEQRDQLFKAVETNAFIKRKADWALQHVNSQYATFEQRMVAFACVEGIFFSASFLLIYWLKKRGVMPGLCHSNELIARDEGLHTTFAVMVHNGLRNRCTNIAEIVKGAVDLECAFVRDILVENLVGLTADSVCTYVQFIADRLLVDLKEPKVFKVANPFEWMERISMDSKVNFFEKGNAAYSVAHKRGKFELSTVF